MELAQVLAERLGLLCLFSFVKLTETDRNYFNDSGDWSSFVNHGEKLERDESILVSAGNNNSTAAARS